ncbi:MAG TPA: hypothetical protein DCZ44_00810 [Flavobacteriaceae bacterium]|nr:hypothetical protein [Flavobacteriaceae bacterium]
MEILIVSIIAFLVAILTFFSGFGLGTILTPVFMFFFPVELSIALTGVVHFFNNIFKIILVGRNANREVLIKFGIPAVLAALIGSAILIHIAEAPPLFAYTLGKNLIEVSSVKFIISILLILFASMDLIPFFRDLTFEKNKLPLGGIMSGFFGGLSGNQGALRSAFLIKAGLSKESFIGTAVVVSTFVDFTRLSVYATRFSQAGLVDNLNLVICATLAGITGSFIGNKLLKKVTIKRLQTIVAVMLIVLAVGFGSGLI